MPHFAHVSLILAPDRSKLSKRHGATSVGQVSIGHCSLSSFLWLLLRYNMWTLILRSHGLIVFISVYLKQLPLTVQGDGLSAPGNGELLGTFRLG